MKILIAPGAFKHSLSANAAAASIARGLQQALPDADLIAFPIADGGNGTLDAWLAQGGQRYTITVHDPLMRQIEADYGILPDGTTAVIEMALASGLELLSNDELNPLQTTTYGTGELLQHALENGARRFIIGMGGSATVDGASGALRALGIKLLDSSGAEIPHGGGYLSQIATIDTSDLDPLWHDCEIIIASDVENPLLGATGAAAIFGPQKGATPEQVDILKKNLSHFAEIIQQQHGADIKSLIGGGAAGGLSAGLIAFLGGHIESGIDLLLKHNDFVARLKDADWVITGEGQMDEQTIYGKGPVGVARLAKEHGVPTIALVGGLNVHDKILHENGIQAAFSIVDKPMSLTDALTNAGELLERAALRIGYLLKGRHEQSPLHVEICHGRVLSEHIIDFMNRQRIREYGKNTKNFRENELDSIFFLVKHKSQIKAFGMLKPVTITHAGQSTDILGIGNIIAVEKGAGNGRRLMQAIQDYLLEHGKIGLGFCGEHVTDFYRKCGYTVVGEISARFRYPPAEKTGGLYKLDHIPNILYLDDNPNFLNALQSSDELIYINQPFW